MNKGTKKNEFFPEGFGNS